MRATMREEASKVKINNNKPLKKPNKDIPIEEIPLDTSDDSFDDGNNDNFCAVYKGYFYVKKGPKCDWIQCIECNK
ncbi:hypothetical protein TNCV_1623291 [Trichonephila clavipes]|nr:hypothetical protein TNCV_1623291 [Trichonephila clavipes]